MASAKDKMKDYLLDHVGEDVPRETLRDVAGGIQDWQRALRTLRQETGLDIVATRTGYILTSDTPVHTPQIRKAIDNKLKYAVLQRDNSTCQRCGANIYNTPNVKLVIDHKIPVELMGTITPEEEERFQKWWKESESHEKEYEIICKRLIVDLRRTEHPDLHKAWKGVWSKLPRTRRLFWSWHSGAAVCAGVILLLGLGWIFLPADDLNISRSGNDRCAGTVLILGNGELIDLGKRQERVVDAGKGTKIRIGENVVSYQTGEQEEAPIQEMNTVRVPRGSEYRLILSDGTKVWLNAESQLIYPVRFTGENREVIMKGEACFEVAKKEKQPFVVKVDEIEVLVTGTLFNVEAYPETKEVKMTLVEGRVEVKTEEHRQLLSPDEQALVDKQEGQIRVRKVVAEEYIGWTRGEFRFTRTRLEEVMTRLARWYDVEVFFAVPDLKNARFTLNLERYDNINKILSKIEKTGRVHFRIQGQCIIVE